MKRITAIISLILVIVMTACCFASCGETPKPADTNKTEQTKAPDTKPAETPTEAATDAPATEAPTEAATEAPTEAVTEAPKGEKLGDTSLEIVGADEDGMGGTIYIGTREQLYEFARYVNDDEELDTVTIKLTADIDLSPDVEGGKHWNPISGGYMIDCTFDGDGHVINGMWIDDEDLEEPDGYGYMVNGSGPIHGYGFFGAIRNDFTVQNVTFNNATINPTRKHAGCVIGTIDSASYITITNVTVNNLYLNGGVGAEGDTTGICFRAGGIVGAAIFGGTIEMSNCTVSGSKIIGFHNIAGLVGSANYGIVDITNCRVENTELHYSASYAKSYNDPQLSRYFADIFHEENSYWGFYHTDEDLANGNTYENVTSYDIRNDVTYMNEEGKTMSYYDLMGVDKFPVSGAIDVR